MIRLLLLTTMLLALTALSACGDEAAKTEPKATATATATATPAGASLAALEALPLDTPREVVERRFGPPSDPGFVSPKIRRGEPAGYRCLYYQIQGGNPRENYVQLCFGARNTLDSKLILSDA